MSKELFLSTIGEGRGNWGPLPSESDNIGKRKVNPDAEPDPEDDDGGPVEAGPGGDYEAGDRKELDFGFSSLPEEAQLAILLSIFALFAAVVIALNLRARRVIA